METAINVLSFIELHSEDCACCESVCATKGHIPKLVVVATKTDLRDNQEVLFDLFDAGKTLVSPAEGRQFAESLRANLYHETSALCRDAVDELFDEIHKMYFPSMMERLHELSRRITMPFMVL